MKTKSTAVAKRLLVLEINKYEELRPPPININSDIVNVLLTTSKGWRNNPVNKSPERKIFTAFVIIE
jgi:hypothetical protein